MTKPADKLVAIRGVAEAFGRCMQLNFQEDFVAGLWLPQLGWELCWRVVEIERTSMETAWWRAPSWSWASIESQIRPSNIDEHQDCSNIAEEFSLVRIEKRRDWSGKMSAAALHLRGKLIPAMCTIYAYDGDQNGRFRGKSMSIDCGNGQSILWDKETGFFGSMFVHIDTTLKGTKPGDEVGVLLLPIIYCSHPRAGDDASYSNRSIMQALVVVPHESAEGEFARIGFLGIHGQFVDDYLRISQLFVEREIILA